jgi:hypothetical protein
MQTGNNYNYLTKANIEYEEWYRHLKDILGHPSPTSITLLKIRQKLPAGSIKPLELSYEELYEMNLTPGEAALVRVFR